MKESFGRIEGIERNDDCVIVKVRFGLELPEKKWKSGESVIIKEY